MEKRYNKFVDSLVPVGNTNAMTGGVLALPNVQVSLSELPEPDDAEIAKMILNDGERALKTRLWTTLNQDWIVQDKEKRRAKKAERKKHKLLSV